MVAATPPSILALLDERLRTTAEQEALQFRSGGETRSLTWKALIRQACRMAAALRAAGVERGDRVLHVSENRHEWVITDLAVQIAGGLHVPVHAPLTGPQIAFQLADSDSRLAIFSSVEQAAKLRDIDVGPKVSFWSYETEGDAGRPLELVAERVERDGDEAVGRELYSSSLETLGPDSLATILYTSGTTGEPKGVMLTQGNLASNTVATVEMFEQTTDDVRLTFLPLSHIFARTCDLYTWVAVGSKLALADSRETVIADCAAFQPTLLNGVPYFFDKVRRVMIEQGFDSREGALKQLFGGNIRFCCSGGAALPDHVFDFYLERGVPVLQGYGLSETSPVITVSGEHDYRRGSTGRPIRDVEVRIADDGEILTRGPHVMPGYYKNDAATREIIRDGWLHTGDLGRLDEDGFLYISGRKKEIIVTAGGKNVSPVLLEQLLTEDPLIVQAMVIGDDRNFLTALLVPDHAALRAMLSDPAEDDAELCAQAEANELIADRVRTCLADLSPYEQVGRFTLLPQLFSIEAGELTPKSSLRRAIITERHAARIESMYET